MPRQEGWTGTQGIKGTPTTEPLHQNTINMHAHHTRTHSLTHSLIQTHTHTHAHLCRIMNETIPGKEPNITTTLRTTTPGVTPTTHIMKGHGHQSTDRTLPPLTFLSQIDAFLPTITDQPPLERNLATTPITTGTGNKTVVIPTNRMIARPIPCLLIPGRQQGPVMHFPGSIIAWWVSCLICMRSSIDRQTECRETQTQHHSLQLLRTLLSITTTGNKIQDATKQLTPCCFSNIYPIYAMTLSSRLHD